MWSVGWLTDCRPSHCIVVVVVVDDDGDDGDDGFSVSDKPHSLLHVVKRRRFSSALCV